MNGADCDARIAVSSSGFSYPDTYLLVGKWTNDGTSDEATAYRADISRTPQATTCNAPNCHSAAVAQTGVPYACGRFGAHMQVTLTNDGPVTFWLEVRAGREGSIGVSSSG